MRTLYTMLPTLALLLTLSACFAPSTPLPQSTPTASLDSFVPAPGSQPGSQPASASASGDEVNIEGCWQTTEMVTSLSKYVKVGPGRYTLTTKNDIGGLMAPAPVVINGDRMTVERPGGAQYVSRFSLSGDTLNISPTTEGNTAGPDVVTYGTATYKRLAASSCPF